MKCGSQRDLWAWSSFSPFATIRKASSGRGRCNDGASSAAARARGSRRLTNPLAARSRPSNLHCELFTGRRPTVVAHHDQTETRMDEKGRSLDFDAARNFLSLLYSDAKAKALVESLRNATLVEHAAKDLLRAAQLPLLPRDEPHVDDDLKRIYKGKPLAPILLI